MTLKADRTGLTHDDVFGKEEMTLPEAIKILENYKQESLGNSVFRHSIDVMQAIDIVLQAAKQQVAIVRDIALLPELVVYDGKPDPKITVTFHEAPDGSKPKSINTKKKPNDKRHH